MNLKKALKEKNKLKGKIKEILDRIRDYNLVEEGSARSYEPEALLEKLFVHIDEMVDVKTRIQLANQEVYSKIFRLSELKNAVSRFQYISCERKVNTTGQVYLPGITTVERDRKVEQWEQEIEEIQEYLDEFNYRKKI